MPVEPSLFCFVGKKKGVLAIVENERFVFFGFHFDFRQPLLFAWPRIEEARALIAMLVQDKKMLELERKLLDLVAVCLGAIQIIDTWF